jgi:hypothetical protein
VVGPREQEAGAVQVTDPAADHRDVEPVARLVEVVGAAARERAAVAAW